VGNALRGEPKTIRVKQKGKPNSTAKDYTRADLQKMADAAWGAATAIAER